MEFRISIQGWEGMGGRVDLVFSADSVALVCQVPLDTHTDEWFEADLRFDRWVYEEALAVLSKGRPVQIPGKGSGYLGLAPRGSRHLQMWISNGTQAFVTTVELRPPDLLPSAEYRSSQRPPSPACLLDP